MTLLAKKWLQMMREVISDQMKKIAEAETNVSEIAF